MADPCRGPGRRGPDPAVSRSLEHTPVAQLLRTRILGRWVDVRATSGNRRTSRRDSASQKTWDELPGGPLLDPDIRRLPGVVSGLVGPTPTRALDEHGGGGGGGPTHPCVLPGATCDRCQKC